MSPVIQVIVYIRTVISYCLFSSLNCFMLTVAFFRARGFEDARTK